jgi:signal transduction histidine kinase
MFDQSRLRFARVLIWIAAALVGGALYLDWDHLQQPADSLHFTEADWQVTSTSKWSAPLPTLNSRDLPANWTHVDLPLALPIALLRQADSRTAGAFTRTTWLRLSTQGLPKATGPWALYGARIKTDGTIAVYANGNLIHRAQHKGPLWNSTRAPLWVPMDKGAAYAPVGEILIRLEHSEGSQVAISSLWLGPTDALQARYYARQWLQEGLPAMLSAAFLAVGVFALFVWLQRRHETGYLLFFCLAVAAFARGLHFYLGRPIANDLFAWLTVNALFWLVLVVHFFLRQLHGQAFTWLTRVLVGTVALVGILTLPILAVLPNTPKVTPLVYAGAALMGLSVATTGGVQAWRSSKEGRLVAVGFGICLLMGFCDWLLQNNVISPEGWYLGAYANAVTFIVFGTLIYRRYINAIADVEQVNANLAQRLQAREAELELSHQRLRKVEQQQTISNERQRLMQDMHDGMGSSLISAIRMADRGGMSDAQVTQILKDCLDDLKLTIDSMEPIDADLLLLLATLRFRLEPRLEGTGITLVWEVQEVPRLGWLDPSSALHILRIVQESITNVLRHASATTVRVGVALEADGVRVTVQDNGTGFDVPRALASASGHGLYNQQRRSQAIGGTVNWQSGPQGTVFSLWLPLASPPNDQERWQRP